MGTTGPVRPRTRLTQKGLTRVRISPAGNPPGQSVPGQDDTGQDDTGQDPEGYQDL